MSIRSKLFGFLTYFEFKKAVQSTTGSLLLRLSIIVHAFSIGLLDFHPSRMDQRFLSLQTVQNSCAAVDCYGSVLEVGMRLCIKACLGMLPRLHVLNILRSVQHPYVRNACMKLLHLTETTQSAVNLMWLTNLEPKPSTCGISRGAGPR